MWPLAPGPPNGEMPIWGPKRVTELKGESVQTPSKGPHIGSKWMKELMGESVPTPLKPHNGPKWVKELKGESVPAPFKSPLNHSK